MRNALSNNSLMWAPTIETEAVDNALVLGPMHENIKNGYFNRVPTLMGIVTQEEAEFISELIRNSNISIWTNRFDFYVCFFIKPFLEK